MNKPELLAPAGSFEHFKAAVENGADAVYCGGKMFNARQNAENFTFEQLKNAVSYAHQRGVKVYMTINTLIKQNEIEEAVQQAEEGALSGIDCFIVQDLGLANILKERYPNIPLHLSTQATTYDEAGVRFAEEAGFKRVVLAREMPLERIKECVDSCKHIETEIFVHGALCVCLSGQCAMSSLIGGRSGNRGNCAQPCRKRYSLEDSKENILGEAGYILSPKDISYLSVLDEIIESGVTSLKIEGRLKTPEYTALTVKTFRKYIDKVFEEKDKVPVERKDLENLEQIFNRGGFSKGYLFGKQNGALLSGESPKHRGLFLGVVRSTKMSTVNKEKKIIELDLKRDISVGDGIEVLGKGFPGGIVSYIRGRNGNVRHAKNGERIWLGDIPGNIKNGEMVYKVSDKALINSVRNTYQKITDEKEGIKGFFFAKEGSVITYTVVDSGGKSVKVSGTVIVDIAEKTPVTKESVLKQLSKTGNTPYKLVEYEIDIEDNLMIPLSEVNKVRRKALEKLQNEE